MDLIKITFTKWHEWNPRSDYKHPFWFAMSNRITEDDGILTLTDREFRAFVHMFCIASQKNCDTAMVNLGKAERVTGIASAVFIECVKKLVGLEICTYSDRSPTDPDGNLSDAGQFPSNDRKSKSVGSPTDHDETPTDPRQMPDLQDTTKQNNNTKEEPPPLPSARFEFDLFAKRYPKPPGPDANARFRAQIKTEQDATDLATAIVHYLAMLALPENDWRSPKQTFAAFLGTKRSGFFWRDFINPASALPSTTAKSVGSFTVPD